MFSQAKKAGKTVHFANLMDSCHLKNAELAKHLQNIQGASCAPGDNVKDEAGYRAVFAVQGPSASHMGAAECLDTISKLLGMAGERSDAIFSVRSSQNDRSSQIVTNAETRRS